MQLGRARSGGNELGLYESVPSKGQRRLRKDPILRPWRTHHGFCDRDGGSNSRRSGA